MIIEVSESVRLRRFDPDAAGSGRGIGGSVLRSLILYASRAGRSELLVTEVYAYNEAARRLFTAAGFKPVAETELGNRYRLGLADG